MTKSVYDVDKSGTLTPRNKPPVVRIGNERLNRNGSCKLSGQNFVACDDHGTAPACWVRHKGTISKCCRSCIRDYCTITESIPDTKYSEEPTSEMDHPYGHSE